jgi:uncharacterized coiled-coil protein SlyX
MDIVAVLTKVVQEQQRTIAEQGQMLERQHATISHLAERLARLEGRQ